MRLEHLRVIPDEEDIELLAERVSDTFWDLDEDKSVEECKTLIKTDCKALCDSLEELGIEAKDPELMKEVNNVRDELAKYCEDTFAFTKTELAKVEPELVEPNVPSYQIKDDINFEEELVKAGAVYNVEDGVYTIDVEFENQFGTLYLEEADLANAKMATLSDGEEGIVINDSFYKIVKSTLITDDFISEGENYFRNHWKIALGHENRVNNIKNLVEGIPDKTKYKELRTKIYEIANKYDMDPKGYDYNKAKADLIKLFESQFKSESRTDEEKDNIKLQILNKWNAKYGTNKKWSELSPSFRGQIEEMLAANASNAAIKEYLEKVMGQDEEEDLDTSTFEDMLKKYLKVDGYDQATLSKLQLEGLKDVIGLETALGEIKKIFNKDKKEAKKYLYKLYLDINSFNTFPFMRSEEENAALEKEQELKDLDYQTILNNVNRYASRKGNYQGTEYELKEFFESFYVAYKNLYAKDKDAEGFKKRVDKLVKAVNQIFHVNLYNGEVSEGSNRIKDLFKDTFGDDKYYEWFKQGKVSQANRNKVLNHLDDIFDNDSYVAELKSATSPDEFNNKVKSVLSQAGY